MEFECEPEDIIRNRLDPWHGAPFHPYSFDALTVTDSSDERLMLSVLQNRRTSRYGGGCHFPLLRPAHDRHDDT